MLLYWKMIVQRRNSNTFVTFLVILFSFVTLAGILSPEDVWAVTSRQVVPITTPVYQSNNDLFIPVPSPEPIKSTILPSSSNFVGTTQINADNDDFDTATAIVGSGTLFTFTRSLDISTATQSDDDPPPSCMGTSYQSVWFRFTAPSTGLLYLNTWESNYDTVLSIYTGSRNNLISLGCNDDQGPGATSELVVQVSQGATYHVMVSSYGSETTGVLSFAAIFEALDKITLPLDLVVLQDETGSMGDDISALAELTPQIWQMLSQLAEVEFRMGVFGFRDYARSGWGSQGDWVYRRYSDLTSQLAIFENGVVSLSADGGSDTPEGALPAIAYLLNSTHPCIDSDDNGNCSDIGDTQPGQQPTFRSGAQRILLLATDATAHEPATTPNYPGPALDTIIEQLIAADITVIGLVPGGAGRIDYVDQLAAATGGSVQDTGASGAEVALAILNALQQLRPVSPALSSIVATPTNPPADFSTVVTLTITLRDTAGAPQVGRQVWLTSNRPGLDIITQPENLTDSAGQTVAFLRSVTTGESLISATDTESGISLANPAQVVFGESGSFGERLNRQIEVANDFTGRILQRYGEITKDVAEQGTYFTNSIGSLRAAIAFDVAFSIFDLAALKLNVSDLTEPVQTKIDKFFITHFGSIVEEGSVSYARIVNFQSLYADASTIFIRLHRSIEVVNIDYWVKELASNHWAYWAAEGLGMGVENYTRDQIGNGIEKFVAGDENYLLYAAEEFSQDATMLANALDSQTTALLNAPPLLTPAQEDLYTEDLARRTTAALTLEDFYNHQAFTLDNLRAAHAQEPEGAAGWFYFWGRIGGQLGATYLCGSICGYIYDLPVQYLETRRDFKDLATAERATAIAQGLLGNASYDAMIIFHNTAHGLDRIDQQMSIRTVTGSIGAIHHIDEGDGFGFMWDSKRNYSEVDVTNTSSEGAAFMLLTKYGFQDKLFGLPYAMINLTQEDVIWLEPGETTRMEVEYHHEEYGYPPDRGSDITFVLLGRNSAGTFRLAHAYSKWEPSRESRSGVIMAQAIDDDLPSMVTPLAVYITHDEIEQRYHAELWISNLFTRTFQAEVTQILPIGANIVATDGNTTGNTLVWNREVGARDVISLSFVIDYPTPIGSEIALPSAQIEITFPTSGESALLAANSPTIYVAAPLAATLETPSLSLLTGGEITVTIQNESSSATSPEIVLRLRTSSNEVIFEAAQTITLPAGGNKEMLFGLPGGIKPAWYTLEVWAKLDGGEALLKSEAVTSLGAEQYVPFIPKSGITQ